MAWNTYRGDKVRRVAVKPPVEPLPENVTPRESTWTGTPTGPGNPPWRQ